MLYWIGPHDGNDYRFHESVRVFIQPIAGGTATQIGAGCRLVDSTPVWSPDGRRILFVWACRNNVLGAWVSTLDGKELKPNRNLPLGAIDQWTAEPPRLLMRATEFPGIAIQAGVDAKDITAVPVSADGTKVTGPSQRLTSLTDNITRVSAALNGRIALSVDANTAHIWGLPIDGGGHATGEPRQLTDGPAGEGGPVLSRDGEKLAYLSRRANDVRLFCKDLANGRERDLSTDGYSYRSVVFKPDGTGIMCVQYKPGSPGFVYYVPLSGGLPKKVWDISRNGGPAAWSPDGKTLLSALSQEASTPRRGAAGLLDLDSMSATVFLEDPELDLWQGKFSHDGRWVTFNATTKDLTSSRIYVVPVRKALMPRREWIAITNGAWDDKPRFSSDDKLIFFVSGHEAPRRLWAQRLRSDMRPDGKPVAVYPLG